MRWNICINWKSNFEVDSIIIEAIQEIYEKGIGKMMKDDSWSLKA